MPQIICASKKFVCPPQDREQHSDAAAGLTAAGASLLWVSTAVYLTLSSALTDTQNKQRLHTKGHKTPTCQKSPSAVTPKTSRSS